MAWKFKKSIKLGPVRLNLSQSGVGGSIGVKGYRKGIDANGRSYTHKSIPGTGIYSREYSSGSTNSKINLDDGSAGEKQLNGMGKVTAVFLICLFFFVWYAGESFWFALGLIGITAIFSGGFSNEKLYRENRNGHSGDRISSGIDELEEELEYFEALEREANGSPFAIFELDESCTRRELDLAFKRLISQYHPDKLTNLGPELQELGHKKSQEIRSSYDKCLEKISKQKPA